MTLPTPDAQASKPPFAPSYPAFAAHSTPQGFPLPSTPPFVSPPSPIAEGAASYPLANHQVPSSADFSHSWDLATGGFKTLTAKRELFPLPQRREQATPVPEPAPTRSYMFLLVIVACMVVMLISGGVVLFMTLQP